VYEVDPLDWPHCGATLRIIALIDDPALCGDFLYPTNVRKWPQAVFFPL